MLSAPRRFASPAQTISPKGFTLIELLVVISIIALLIGILLPALGAARSSAKSIANLSNLRQIGIATVAYTTEQKGYYPMHSSSTSTSSVGGTKPRWADYLYPYMNNTDIFLSPNLDAREIASGFTKAFFHQYSDTPAHLAALPSITPVASANPPASGEEARHGGYGYNFQYLGNARPTPTYHARASRDVLAASETVAFGDTTGSRDGSSANDPGDGGAAVYALDPPIGSINYGSKGNGKGVGSGYAYYEGGDDENAGSGSYDPEFEYDYRSAPATRNSGDTAGFTFADGHGEALGRDIIDDYNGDGTADNGYWNGRGNASLR
ncbi:type II secretion system protein [Algisphaera agarilytica]|uniref:Prepilin-type N-terminal cleavage/methylation domain-containing protein n=1 Tax=Algisphaera agarilytica TaxID=1385975 RepID=A0A7X0LKN8_9BACT|nr:prepilin-type N-terminal cleavage/methylation domain-containing protein [Algisphaera agarilytica]MBB6430635.1 prepilin-type N-terminal cleavage/methylation domain-containing protein [Algisphaera agarilytica]